MTPAHPALNIAGGDGLSVIHIQLQPVRFIRPSRNEDRWESAFTAATLTGAEFRGHASDGPSRFEANVYAPEGFVDDEGDRCLLASFEFHHVALESAEGGIFQFTGTLAGANAYSQDTYDRITAGEPMQFLAEMAEDFPGGIRYLPPDLQSLDGFRGWNAAISCWPLAEGE